MAKILITGATGFIGSHLFDLFLSKGYDVYGISNTRTKKSISKIKRIIIILYTSLRTCH